jgi:hypothetical protein
MKLSRLVSLALCVTAAMAVIGCNNDDNGGTTTQINRVDRMAIPAINTALIDPGTSTSARKDSFNLYFSPSNDAYWKPRVISNIQFLRTAILTTLGTPDADSLSAQQLTDIVIPDVVTIDFSKDVTFVNHTIPNGRKLTDDVIDAELGLVLNRGHWLTGGSGIADRIDANDVPFLNMFPYEAAPHMALNP